MAITLTPAQEAALSAFDDAADVADAADHRNETAQHDLVAAQVEERLAAQAAIDSYADALEKGRAFITAMLPNRTPPTPTAALTK